MLRSLLRLAARASLVAAVAAPAHAQSMATGAHSEAVVENVSVATPEHAQGAANGDLAVDDSALRYYASLKQTARVEAEIRRLQHFHPTWTVPADLYAAQQTGGREEEPLWALFTADRIPELRAAIDAKSATDPNWRPSDDLARKLRGKEVRALVNAALKAKRWHAAVDIAETEARSIDIKDVQLRWNIAFAYKEIHRTNKAFELLYSVLATSRDPVQRLVTAQKSLALLPMADAEKLIGMGRSTPDGRNEFEPIALDVTRARISAFLHDEPAHEVSPSDFEAVQATARASDDPNQSGLVAWYFYKRGELHDALEWFKWSLSHGGDSMIAHGLAHTLRRLGMLRETEEVSFAWREPLVNNNILFVDILERELTRQTPPYIEPARLGRYAQVTVASQSGEGAQALAWYAYNSCQFDTALTWFRHAVAWLPKEATVYGYALTLRRLKRTKEYYELLNRYDGLFPSVVELAFPDEASRPPGACDPQPAGRRSQPGQGEPAQVEPTEPRPETGLRYLGEWHVADAAGAPRRPVGSGVVAVRAGGYARVPSPDGQGATQVARMPVFRRDEFPVAVRAENDLRFEGSESRPSATGGAHAPERYALVALTARRVPGVTAMPYERYGFALLPGWNGTGSASETPAARLPPAAGTAWAVEIASGAPAMPNTAPRASDVTARNVPPLSRLR